MTPAFIYIFVVFVSKNREKRSKKRKIDHFAECLSQYTRQSGLPQDSTTVLCRVLKPWHSAKFQTFAECQDPALGKAATWRHPGPALCRVPDADTRQSLKLCRVSAVRHSAKCRPRVLCRVPRLSAKSLPSARNPTLGKDPFAVGGFAEWRLPSVTLAECKLAFVECNRHSAKPVNPVVSLLL